MNNALTDETLTDRMELALPSTPESVDRLEQAAVGMAEAAGFDADAVLDIALAVREAAANAVLHGNRSDPAKLVTASLTRTARGLRIEVADQGSGFDPDEVPDPHAQENLMRGSGRGVLLMRAMMDEVRFHEAATGMEVTMTKHHPAAG